MMQLEKSSDGQTEMPEIVSDIDRKFLTGELEKLFNSLLARDAGKSTQNDNILNAIQDELRLLAEAIRVLPFRRRGSGDVSVTTEGQLTDHQTIPDLPAAPQAETFSDNKSGDILREIRHKSSLNSMPPPVQPIVQDDKAVHDLENKVNSLIDVCRDALDSTGRDRRVRDDTEERNNKHMMRLENLMRSLIRELIIFTIGFC